MPRERDPAWRLPHQHASPFAHLSIGGAFIPAAARARFHKDRGKWLRADVVFRGPPRLHLLHEHREGLLDRSLHPHTLTNDAASAFCCHLSLLSYCLSSRYEVLLFLPP